jgi:hypothetical protein
VNKPLLSLAGTILVSIVLAGCSDDREDTIAVPPILSVEEATNASGATIVEGFLLAAPTEAVRLCGALLESYPPQCGQPWLVLPDFDAAAVPNVSTNTEAAEAERVVWTDSVIRLLGDLTDGTLTVPSNYAGPAIAGRALAGPVCPVERSPPDPGCSPRPVAGTEIRVLQGGDEVTRTSTDSLGRFLVMVGAGTYVVEPQPVQGLLGTPAPVTVVIGSSRVEVDLAYDTGIR